MQHIQSAYGQWSSPITAERVAHSGIRLSEIQIDGNDIYWLERRPSDKGRTVIVRYQQGQSEDMTMPDFNVRSHVHEYGGGSYCVAAGNLYFVNDQDQCIYHQCGKQPPQLVTQLQSCHYADLVLDQTYQSLFCIQEFIAQTGEVVNRLICIDLINGEQQVIAAGDDFYASPCISPDGQSLAWLSWNHPDMPWDKTQLWLAHRDETGRFVAPKAIVTDHQCSLFQPQWSSQGILHFVSDVSDWWNIYQYQSHTNNVMPLCAMHAEFGLPQWVFAMSTYGFSGEDVISAYSQDGEWRLMQISQQQSQTFDLPFSDINSVRVNQHSVVFIGASATKTAQIIQLNLQDQTWQILNESHVDPIDERYIAKPQAITYPVAEDHVAHAFLYLPFNPDYPADPDEKPPLLVKTHGGPTTATSSALNWEIQFWTSRGIAVLDVNYIGSTGYGRKYRQGLYGQWGISDVDDCVYGVHYLANEGLIDPQRVAIRGGSAGGYTTLSALTFRDTFKAGASYYGISDLEILASDTHKFEAHYLDQLVGQYPAEKARYQARSPIHFVQKLNAAIIFFQGLQDKVVPPNQAEVMVKALQEKGLPVSYITFADEGHGFRRAENIQTALDAELTFYADVFDF